MKYSQLFGKTIKADPSGEVSANAKYLIRGGFIDKLMAGSYSLMPLGRLVEQKIEQIIREEMDSVGAQEVLMPLMHPKELWNETGRWDSAKEVMYQFKKNEKEYALSFTHEEIVLDLIRKHANSYKDFPIKIYHFSTKFRNELRAKSGILRGREFLMKDLYSAHTTKEDLDKYYFEVAEAYMRVFGRMGLEVVMTEAAGGVFTKDHTHEFQLFSEAGEDTIYFCKKCDLWQNQEILDADETCFKCGGKIDREKSAIEVGNIFRFGTSYSQKMGVSFTDEDGKKQFVYLGSYGIGTTRLVGAIVEVSNDDKGIIWPKSVAPFDVHLVSLSDEGEKVYKQLKEAGVDVLWDDRADVSAGEKFADADLIGIPIRLVVSKKVGEGKVEWKERRNDKIAVIGLEEALKLLKAGK